MYTQPVLPYTNRVLGVLRFVSPRLGSRPMSQQGRPKRFKVAAPLPCVGAAAPSTAAVAPAATWAAIGKAAASGRRRLHFVSKPPLAAVVAPPPTACARPVLDGHQVRARVQALRDERWIEPALQWRRKLLQSLMSHPRNRRSLFNSPAASQLGSADLVSRYEQAVRQPMDLATVKRKLDAGEYDRPFPLLQRACDRVAARSGWLARGDNPSQEQGGEYEQNSSMEQLNREHAQLLEQLRLATDVMLEDMRLVFSNALSWNAAGSVVASAATALRESLEEAVEKHERDGRAQQWRSAASSDACDSFSDDESDEGMDHEGASLGSDSRAVPVPKRPCRCCALCLCQQLWFDPPQLQCQGPCSNAIGGEYCYSTRDGTRQWCDRCFVKMFPEHFETPSATARRVRHSRHSSFSSLPVSGSSFGSAGFGALAMPDKEQEDAAKRAHARAQRRLSQQTYEGDEMWGGRGRGSGRRRSRGCDGEHGVRDDDEPTCGEVLLEHGAGAAHAPSNLTDAPREEAEHVADRRNVIAPSRRREAEAELAAQVAEIQRQAALQDLGCNTTQDALSVRSALRGINRMRVPVSRSKAKDPEYELREPWVRCTKAGCRRHMHRVCAMYNPREQLQRASVGQGFLCPHCALDSAAAAEAAVARQQPAPRQQIAEAKELADGESHSQAAALPRTKLGDYIEGCVRKMLRARLSTAELDASSAANPANVTVRVVSAARSSVSVSSAVRMHFVDHTADDRANAAFEYPESLTCVSKCVLVFQTDPIDGRDVCLFSLYAMEFGEDCPLPNRGRVYIAYLDSVRYFQPARLRTALYHEVLVSYLSACAQRRFDAVHIWACPPSRTTDYVFWRHPANQRTPSRQRLRAWYAEALEIAKTRGILADVDNLFDSHFAWVDGSACALSGTAGAAHAAWATMTTRRTTSSATSAFSRDRSSWPKGLPPFFPGDCWPLEAEQAALSGGWIAENAATGGFACAGPVGHVGGSLSEHLNRFAQVDEHLSNRITCIVKDVPGQDDASHARSARSARSTRRTPAPTAKLGTFVCRDTTALSSSVSGSSEERRQSPASAMGSTKVQSHGKVSLAAGDGGTSFEVTAAAAAAAAASFPVCSGAAQPTEVQQQQARVGFTTGGDSLVRDNSLYLSPVAPSEPERRAAQRPARPALNIEMTSSNQSSQQVESFLSHPRTQAHQAATTPRSMPLSPSSRARHQHVSTRPPTWLQREVALTVQVRWRATHWLMHRLHQLHLTSLSTCSLQRLKDDNFVCNFNKQHAGDERFVTPVPNATEGLVPDPDPLMPSKFIDTRQTFLRVCQQLHYQFDTHRHAKFSTMMLVHRLLTPYCASDTIFICASCQAPVLAASHWFDPLDAEFDVCDSCAKTMREDGDTCEDAQQRRAMGLPPRDLLFADRSCVSAQQLDA